MQRQVAQISPDALIAARAAHQHGVVAAFQVLREGLSREQIQWRLRTGRLHRIHRGVYAVGHAVLSREAHWMAAVLACGEGAALSHRDAAALWAIRPSASPTIDVTVPSRAGRSRRRRLRVHRSLLPPEEVTTQEAIPVTTPARTLLDLAAVVSAAALKKSIKEAERLRLFDLSEVNETLARNAGRSGCPALAKALSRYEEPAFTRSDLEDLMVELCERLGISTPRVNAPVAGYEVDFLWPAERLIIETDGREDHLTRHAFEEDRVRDARLTVLGHRVVRFTYRQLRYDRAYVIRTLKRLLQ